MTVRRTCARARPIALASAALVLPACAAFLDLDVQYTDGGSPDGGVDGAAPDGHPDGTTVGSDAATADAPVLDARADTSSPDGAIADAGADVVPSGDASGGTDATPPPTDAGIQFVQGNAGNALANSSAAVISFAAAVQAHDTIVVATGYDVTSPVLVSDTLGSTYHAAITTPDPNGGPNGAVATIWYALDVAAGADTVSLTLQSAPNSYFEIYIHEYSGIGAFDGASGNVGSFPSGPGAMTSGATTTTAANELLFGYGLDGTVTPGAGFTARSTFASDLTEDMTVDVPASVEATAMCSGGEWSMLAATFKPR